MRRLLRKANRRDAPVTGRHEPEYLNIMLRGGRMTKVAGVAASFAPTLGTVGTALFQGASAIALGSAFSVTGAVAGSCVLNAGTFECSGPADPTTDVTQTLQPAGPLSISTTADFGIDTSVNGGNALTLGQTPGTTSINLQELYGAAITGADTGIFALTYGGATDVTLDTSGTIVGLSGDGIEAINLGTGDTTITNTNASGTASVTGDYNGINAYNYGGGALSITADNVTGTTASGINAYNDYYSTSLSITTTGDVTGDFVGIFATNIGTGDLSVMATNPDGTATTSGFGGIVALNGNGGAIDIVADNVNGELDAIYANNDPAGTTISITTYGDVMSDTYGIRVLNYGTGDLTITAQNSDGTASVTGGEDGIRAANANGGALNISADNVTGTDNDAINAINDVYGTSLSVTTTGEVVGGDEGIETENFGSGDLTIASQNSDGTASVTGDEDGIKASNYNGGALSISADTVTGTTGIGINALNDTYGTSLSITTTGDVSGDFVGIYANNDGTGDLSVMATNPDGTATTSGYGGIVALNSNGGAIDIVADNVNGELDAVFANNDAAGTSVSVTTYGDVVSDTYGIRGLNYGTGDLTITAQNSDGTASVTGGEDGIRAANANGGALNIAADTVTGTDNDAINAYNDASGTSLSVMTTGELIAGDDGIDAENFGSGDLTITAQNSEGTASVTGDDDGITAVNYNGGAVSIAADNVTGTTQNGITAYNDANGTSLSISTTGDVNGDFVGIYATNLGTGDLSVMATNPDGTATTSGFGGIVALNSNGGAIAIIADNANGELDAIYANNGPAGSTVSVTSYGDVTSDTYGIRVYNYGAGDVSIIAQNSDGTASVTGGEDGIRATNFNGGALNIAADNVTGTANDAINAYSDASGTSLSVMTTGELIAGDDGIFARNLGTGDVSITAQNSDGTALVTGGDEGIRARNFNGGALSVAADNVTGTAGDAINAKNDASGTSLSVTTTGEIIGGEDGIVAKNDGSGDMSITAQNDEGTASVTGGDEGIRARNANGGALSIAADNVTGTGNDAINARNDAAGSSLSVTTTGELVGGDDGIRARNFGSGDVSITVQNDEGTASVTGGDYGIRARNANGGALSISADNVTGTANDAVRASNDASGTSLSVTTTGEVVGGVDGIDALNRGTGDLTIVAQNSDGTASVTGGDYGIRATNANGGALSIAADNVTGTANEAIYAINKASGTSLSVTTTGEVVSERGILAVNYGSGDLTITAQNSDGTASIDADTYGIRAFNSNGGALTIAADNVMNQARDAINASNDNGGTSLSVTTTGEISGRRDGIAARNDGSGDLTIVAQNSDGTASVTGDSSGIYAENYNGGAVSIAVDNVTARDLDAIRALNDSSGTSLSVTVTGEVVAETFGIFARNNGTGDLIISAQNSDGTGSITGEYAGIYAQNYNGGALSIFVDNVTSDYRDAVFAENDFPGTDLSVAVTGEVVASSDAINARNEGTGDLTITVQNSDGTTSVTGGNHGIRATNANGGTLNITADTVTGRANDGVSATNDAGGTSLSVTTTGEVVGGSSGIYAENFGSGDLTITAQNSDGTASATGGDYGIRAFNANGGALSIAADTVTGTDFDGINAQNDASGTSLSVTTTGEVVGSFDGINARNSGAGDLTITAQNGEGTASVIGEYDDGIQAYNYNGGALSIAADNVTGTGYYGEGINAQNDASGTSLSVTVTGEIVASVDGILARNLGTGDLTIASQNNDGTASVNGGDDGIIGFNYNGGSVSIASDNITATEGAGINAFNDAYGTTLSVTTTGEIVAANDGIVVENLGTGDVSITAQDSDGTASVTGGDTGIMATNGNGGALSIAADNVTGSASDAINASNDASSTGLSVTTTGEIVGGGNGIVAENLGTGDVSITAQNSDGAASVTGGDDGIVATNANGGTLSIAADNVTGSASDAISASNDASSTGLNVTTTGEVVGGGKGIVAENLGSGDVSITAQNSNGAASVTGGDDGIVATNANGGALTIAADNVTATAGDGINASNGASGSTTSIATTGSVTGDDNGIYARHYGSGALSITVAGETTGTTNSGIDADTGLGGFSVIALNDGADVSGGTYAILNGSGDSNVYFNDGATVSGVTQLGLGSDDLTIADATITDVTVLDGGDDSDTADGFVDVLTFDGFDGTFGADLLNWEEIVFDTSITSFTGSEITAPTVTLQNNTVFGPTQTDFMLNAGLFIDASSAFDAGTLGMGNVMINGNVTNNGTLSTVDDAADDQLTVNGNLTGTGTLALDADVSTASADRISIAGNANGPGGISVNGFGMTDLPEAITLVDVGGSTSAGAFDLRSSNFTLADGRDVQAIGAFSYRLDFDDGANEFFLTPFDENGAVLNNPVVFVLEAYPSQLTLLNTPGRTFQTWGNRSSVNQNAVAQSLFDLDPGPENAIWLSFGGTRAEYDGRSTLGSDVETDVTSFEMGLDFPLYEGATGRWIAGASIALQEADTDINSATTLAGIETQASSLTLNALWLSDSQFYANGQLRYSNFSTDMTLPGVGLAASGARGEGVAASIELGKAFAVSETLTLVPQIQFTHSDVRGNGIADPFGSPFVGLISDGETTAGRVGLHAERVTGRGSLFGSLSYIHAFDNETAVDFALGTFATNLDDDRIELRAGGQMTVGENSVLYGGITAQGGLSDFSNDNSFSITGGLRVNF